MEGSSSIFRDKAREGCLRRQFCYILRTPVCALVSRRNNMLIKCGNIRRDKSDRPESHVGK